MTENTIYLHTVCTDFDEFCANVLNWDLEYRQIEAGPFGSEILSFGNGRIIFVHGKMERRMLQRGTAPKGLVTFGLLAEPNISIYWRHQDVSGNELFVFPPNGELNSISQADFNVFVVSLSEQKLDQVCESLGLPAFRQLTRQHEVFRCNPEMLGAFRRLLRQTKRDFTSRHKIIDQEQYLKQLENELAYHLVNLLADNSRPITGSRPRKRDLALKSAVNYIRHSVNTVVTIPELCSVCNASQRTLEYAFRERYGLTPKEYTQIYQLNNVRRALREARPENGQVSNIAEQYGFWHMGQFSSNYKKLFCELPSTTLKR